MSKKLIHEMSDEDLVAMISKSPVPAITSDKVTEVGKFVVALNIKHGDTKVPAALIYHTYRGWKGPHERFQSKSYFFRDFKQIFTPIRSSDGVYYLLDPAPFDLSKETYFLIRFKHRREKSRKKTQKPS